MVPMVLGIWPALFSGFHLLSSRKGNHSEDHEHAEQEEMKP
jgi:hypothetical protein